VERKDSDNWVPACRNLEVNGGKEKQGRKTWEECLKRRLNRIWFV